MRRSIARVLAVAERAGCDAEFGGGPQSVIPGLISRKTRTGPQGYQAWLALWFMFNSVLDRSFRQPDIPRPGRGHLLAVLIQFRSSRHDSGQCATPVPTRNRLHDVFLITSHVLCFDSQSLAFDGAGAGKRTSLETALAVQHCPCHCNGKCQQVASFIKPP